MKRLYIKPEMELATCRLCEMLAASTNGTEWHTGTDGEGDDNTVGPTQPDPNADAKQSSGFWEEGPQSPNIWGDGE